MLGRKEGGELSTPGQKYFMLLGSLMQQLQGFLWYWAHPKHPFHHVPSVPRTVLWPMEKYRPFTHEHSKLKEKKWKNLYIWKWSNMYLKKMIKTKKKMTWNSVKVSLWMLEEIIFFYFCKIWNIGQNSVKEGLSTLHFFHCG